MIWHIAKHEFYDNLNSLRFALATGLLLALMLTNAVGHLREQPERIRQYLASTAESLNVLISSAENSLYELAQTGPGLLHKAPSPLRFCADGGESFLPNAVEGRHSDWETSFIVGGRRLKSFWQLQYPSIRLDLHDIRPDVTKVDWAFIIGYVLSLIALLFTFDSISSERDQGTLRLMLAHPIPRHTVLIGKFFGALISILIPLSVAALMNLLVISTSSDVQLGPGSWVRLGIIFLSTILYTCLFLALGLLVSARVQQSVVSLVILLLVWVIFAVFLPSTAASIASSLSSPMTYDELTERRAQIRNELSDAYESRYLKTLEFPFKTLQVEGEFVTKEAEQSGRLNQEYLTQQIAQAKRARAITRISPVTILQHLFETLVGTGFNRHLQFLENAQRYARGFRTFVVEIDRRDPDSLQVIGVREGMSEKKVAAAAIPIFEDKLSLTRDFNAVVTDLLLLGVFVVVLFLGAHLAFVRAEV